jgi:hypothetical protein
MRKVLLLIAFTPTLAAAIQILRLVAAMPVSVLAG